VGSLARRLSALEDVAEAARLRHYRAAAAGAGVPVEEFMALAGEFEQLVDRLQAQGRSFREIIGAVAAKAGVDPDDLERQAIALADSW